MNFLWGAFVLIDGIIKMIEIDSIVYVERSGALRQIVVICGIPFYKSTGIKSGYEGTWLPFLGVADENSVGTYSAKSIFGSYVHTEDDPWVKRNLPKFMEHYFKMRHGWLIKFESEFLYDFRYAALFYKDNRYLMRRSLFATRLGQPILAIASLLLDGGWWVNTKKGKFISDHLKRMHPIEGLIGQVKVKEPSRFFSEDELPQINNWLVDTGAIVNVNRKLQDRFSTGREDWGEGNESSITKLTDIYRLSSVSEQVDTIQRITETPELLVSKEGACIYSKSTELDLLRRRVISEMNPMYLLVPPINSSLEVDGHSVSTAPPNVYLRTFSKAMDTTLRENLSDVKDELEKNNDSRKVEEVMSVVSRGMRSIMLNLSTVCNKMADLELRITSVSYKEKFLKERSYKFIVL